MDQFDIRTGHNVAVIWDYSTTADSQTILVQEIRAVTGQSGYVAMENIDRLQICNSKLKTGSQLTSSLKLAGFTEITEIQSDPLTDEELNSIKQFVDYKGNDLTKVMLRAKKPDFEIGSSAQLKLSFVTKSKTVDEKPQLDPNTKKAWTLSAIDMNDDDVDLIDSDELLDEDDLKKPDPASLRAMDCGDGKKKKRACKNCTCGLAEELDGKGSTDVKKLQVKSSCGSCYLGDAFRCASCPYMGMPAFKPGEKILLADQTLTDA
ncbi:anamorsin isoform X2 [Rhincodon typus]|uniref:anamorsin isoform X2 n=1 Tax=Rhincodon typus TaxID=259920 RepID=UPI00202F6C7E|nr:anamorsin isoform X2 [Rhincodon typus]XP_048461514.1 anamorsin isoform X2 [Rhincodon typus]